MKKIILFILVSLILVTFTGCQKKEKDISSEKENSKEEFKLEQNSKSLVLYFSATGNTKTVAERIANVTSSDCIEIIPEIKYTSQDLDYNNNNSRANKEQNDNLARPKIANEIKIDDYEVIYLGYPIWWGTIPKIILTLIDSYNFEGKTIIPFCTSGSTGIEQSISDLKSYNNKIKFVNSKRLNTSVTNEEIKEWLKEFLIEELPKLYIRVNNYNLTVSLANNSSSKAFIEKLHNQDLTIEMHDYGNFEKVGNLGFSLPTNDEQITTKSGDLILYQGNQITLYYDSNSWNFTKLGSVENIENINLKNILGTGNVTMTFSLKK